MNGFLLDTNVISELVKPKPESRVVTWIDKTDEDLLFLSVLTLGEIRKGITAMPFSARRSTLHTWLERNLLLRFAGRILAIDQPVADHWGRMAGSTLARKVHLPVIEGLFAATAEYHHLVLVTRNTQDIAATGVTFLDPWTG